MMADVIMLTVASSCLHPNRVFVACFTTRIKLGPVFIRLDEIRGLIINVTDVRSVDARLVVVDKEDGSVLWAQR